LTWSVYQNKNRIAKRVLRARRRSGFLRDTKLLSASVNYVTAAQHNSIDRATGKQIVLWKRHRSSWYTLAPLLRSESLSSTPATSPTNCGQSRVS